MNNYYGNLGGFLLDWPRKQIEREDLVRLPGFHFVSTIGETHWERYVLQSDQPLCGEAEPSDRTPFSYPIVIRRSGRRMLFLSITIELSTHIIANLLPKVLRPRLKPVTVAVDRLVKMLVERPSDFTLFLAHARLHAFGVALRTASFYGSDLGEASFFRSNINLMTFYNCGLRDAKKGTEILRIGSDGNVSFVFSQDDRLQEVQDTLSYLSNHGYLTSNILDDSR